MPLQFGVPEEIIEKVHDKELPMSAYSPYLSPIHDRHCIGVNMAFALGDWVDMMIFGDGGFYFKNKAALMQYPRPRIAVNPNIRRKPNVVGVKHISRDGRIPLGISRRPGFISWNRNTGGAAINLAYHLGAKRIFLLGFDMNLGKGHYQHWHSAYNSAAKKGPKDHRHLPFRRHLQCFSAIARDAGELGIEILNVSMTSAIKEFKKITLKEALEYGKL